MKGSLLVDALLDSCLLYLLLLQFSGYLTLLMPPLDSLIFDIRVVLLIDNEG
jgi:hypothetical protein